MSVKKESEKEVNWSALPQGGQITIFKRLNGSKTVNSPTDLNKKANGFLNPKMI